MLIEKSVVFYSCLEWLLDLRRGLGRQRDLELGQPFREALLLARVLCISMWRGALDRCRRRYQCSRVIPRYFL